MKLPPPITTPLNNVLLDEPLLMMGAGPVPLTTQVAAANSKVINHLGTTMASVIDAVKSMARYVFQTETKYVFGVAGSGSATMEMALCNLIEEGDKVLCLSNGHFGSRLAEMASRCGGIVNEVEKETCSAFDPSEVRTLLEANQYDALSIVQGETSSTVWNNNLAEICLIAKEFNVLIIVDAICTLSTMPLLMDEWKIDAVITGGQKGLSSIPGVSLIAFSDNGWSKITNRKKPPVQWCFDALLANAFWNHNQYHYTAPVSGILALYEALRLVCEETLEQRFQRHLACSRALQAGIEAMGLSLYAPQSCRLNSVVGVRLPEEIESKLLLQYISHVHRVEISGAFGKPIIRIGQMGEQCRSFNLFRTLHALGDSINFTGFNVNLPDGMAALEKKLNEFGSERAITTTT